MDGHMRKEVADFLSLAPLPSSGEADEDQIGRLADALANILPPVSREEAAQLASAFGPDECFGLAWTLLHLIESAPGGAPLALIQKDNEWVRLLHERAERQRA
jgi:hypothetical protein